MKAFTLIELLVAMLISGLVIASSMESYLVIKNQSDGYFAISDTINKLLLLHVRLNEDIEKAEMIKRIDGRTFSICGREVKNQVIYETNPFYLIRSANSQSDTFFVQTNDIVFKFQDHEVIHDIMDEIKFSVRLFDSNETIHFMKLYSNQQLMNYNQSDMR